MMPLNEYQIILSVILGFSTLLFGLIVKIVVPLRLFTKIKALNIEGDIGEGNSDEHVSYRTRFR